VFWDNPTFQKKYFEFFYKLLKFDKVVKILDINFQKPWWDIIWRQKWSFGITLFSETIQSVYAGLTPLILTYIIFNQDYNGLFLYILSYLLLELFNRIALRLNLISVLQTSNSLEYNAYKFFLTVDPIFHGTKSSGQILSKIRKASSDFEDIITNFLQNIVTIIVGYITVIGGLYYFNSSFGLLALVSFLIISAVTIVANFVNARSFKKPVIEVEDQASIISVENLQQNSFIRSSFATPEQNQKTKAILLKVTSIIATRWFTNGISITVTRTLYIISLSLLILGVLNSIKSGSLKPEIGIALVVTFANGASKILRIGDYIKNFITKLQRIQDLFEFIRNFGKQTYPVLETDNQKYV